MTALDCAFLQSPACSTENILSQALGQSQWKIQKVEAMQELTVLLGDGLGNGPS
jgi:hypothetical protein